LEQNIIKQNERIRYSKKVKILTRPKNITLIQELTTDVPDLQIIKEDKNDDTNTISEKTDYKKFYVEHVA
ncbi:18801_t:CDS:2, partial [Funneliformis geosporum]